MSSEGNVKPEKRPSIGKIIAVIACLIAVAATGYASIHIAINESRFPVVRLVQFLGSLLATWGAVTYGNPVDKKKGSGAKNV
jgi:hypothetical protein